jgi:hypothetical protein
MEERDHEEDKNWLQTLGVGFLVVYFIFIYFKFLFF